MVVRLARKARSLVRFVPEFFSGTSSQPLQLENPEIAVERTPKFESALTTLRNIEEVQTPDSKLARRIQELCRLVKQLINLGQQLQVWRLSIGVTSLSAALDYLYFEIVQNPNLDDHQRTKACEVGIEAFKLEIDRLASRREEVALVRLKVWNTLMAIRSA
jgi:hypothetical protein